VTILGITYPGFRYVLVLTSAAIASFLWFVLYRTRFGVAVRASVDDRETVSALGVRIDLIYTLMFMLSALLAGVAGVLGGTYLQLSPGEDTTILTYSLVVIIVGGLGSLLGAVVSALVLGQILSFSLAFVPELSMFLVFVPMAVVLAVRPQGLFGRTA
jgi:branched-chain amino acid transport system permease protein